MTTPTTEPTGATTRERVTGWGKLAGADADATVVDPVVGAVNALMVRWCGLGVGADGDVAAPAPVQLAATMLAARLVRRRNTPGGVEAVTEGGVAYVQRTDPDVAMLLAPYRRDTLAVG